MKTRKIIILSVLLMLCASSVFALSFQEKFACEVGKVGCPVMIESPAKKARVTDSTPEGSVNESSKEMNRLEDTLPCQLAQINCPVTAR